jgi:hypothetical protein
MTHRWELELLLMRDARAGVSFGRGTRRGRNRRRFEDLTSSGFGKSIGRLVQQLH